MRRSAIVLGLATAALLVGGMFAKANGGESPEAAAEKAEKSVTVFPIVIKPGQGFGDDFEKRVAAVVGLFLEKLGIEDIELAEKRFDSPETNDVAQIAAAFAKLVREKPIKTEYAIYGEIVGTPKTGPKEIRTIVVDRQGKIILAAGDNKQTYARTSDIVPKDPMSCSIFIARKVQKLWGLTEPSPEEAPQGKMAEYWRKQSGLPPEKELAAIKERFQAMVKNVKTSKFVVYPVRIGSGTDKKCAAELAEMLNEQSVCQAVVSKVDPKLQIKGDPNQQKVLWDTARAFRQFVRKNPPEVDYAMYADYGIHRSSSGETQVRYVHAIVCDRAGDWVIVDFQNSHHPDFQSIGPKSQEDCNRLVIKRAKGALSDQ